MEASDSEEGRPDGILKGPHRQQVAIQPTKKLLFRLGTSALNSPNPKMKVSLASKARSYMPEAITENESVDRLRVDSTLSLTDQRSYMRQQSVQILRQNDNLDLSSYKPFIQDFYRFAGHLFDFDSNIFKKSKQDQGEQAQQALRRSTENEYNLTLKQLRIQEGNRVKLSPERINCILKKYPPFPSDAVHPEDIQTFQKKGQLGWSYLTSQILREDIEEKLTLLKDLKKQSEKKRGQDSRRHRKKDPHQVAMQHLQVEPDNTSSTDRRVTASDPMISGSFSAFAKGAAANFRGRGQSIRAPRVAQNTDLKEDVHIRNSNLRRQETSGPAQSSTRRSKQKSRGRPRNASKLSKESDETVRVDSKRQKYVSKSRYASPGTKNSHRKTCSQDRADVLKKTLEQYYQNSFFSTNDERSKSLSKVGSYLQIRQKQNVVSNLSRMKAKPKKVIQLPPHLFVTAPPTVEELLVHTDIKLVLLKLLNRDVQMLTQLGSEANGRLVANFIKSGFDPASNPQFDFGQLFTFHVDETQEPEPSTKRPLRNSIYQFVKTHNFLTADRQNKKIKVAFTTRMSNPEEVPDPRPHPSLPKVSKYEYVRIAFKEMTVGDLLEGSSAQVPEEMLKELVALSVYGRIDRNVQRVELERQQMSFDSGQQASANYSRCQSRENIRGFSQLTRSSRSASNEGQPTSKDSKQLLSTNHTSFMKTHKKTMYLKGFKSNQYFISKHRMEALRQSQEKKPFRHTASQAFQSEQKCDRLPLIKLDDQKEQQSALNDYSGSPASQMPSEKRAQELSTNQLASTDNTQTPYANHPPGGKSLGSKKAKIISNEVSIDRDDSCSSQRQPSPRGPYEAERKKPPRTNVTTLSVYKEDPYLKKHRFGVVKGSVSLKACSDKPGVKAAGHRRVSNVDQSSCNLNKSEVPQVSTMVRSNQYLNTSAYGSFEEESWNNGRRRQTQANGGKNPLEVYLRKQTKQQQPFETLATQVYNQKKWIPLKNFLDSRPVRHNYSATVIDAEPNLPRERSKESLKSMKSTASGRGTKNPAETYLRGSKQSFFKGDDPKGSHPSTSLSMYRTDPYYGMGLSQSVMSMKDSKNSPVRPSILHKPQSVNKQNRIYSLKLGAPATAAQQKRHSNAARVTTKSILDSNPQSETMGGGAMTNKASIDTKTFVESGEKPSSQNQ